MSSTEDDSSKRREERIAREKARIEKLREMNLKKYSKYNLQQNSSSSSLSLPKAKSNMSCPNKNNLKLPLNGTAKRPIPVIPKKSINNGKSMVASSSNSKKDKSVSITESKVNKTDNDNINNDRKQNPLQEIVVENGVKDTFKIPKLTVTKDGDTRTLKSQHQMRKSSGVSDKSKLSYKKIIEQPGKSNTKREEKNVFERLYTPKLSLKQIEIDKALKLQTDPNFLQQVIKESNMIISCSSTVSEPKAPVRRSISAIHLKRISKNEIPKCIHKWTSIGEKIDKVHLRDKNEDDMVEDERIVSAVKSERNKVKFQSPLPFNTPRPERLQSRLHSWLQKRGKSIESYHHLQCFGLHHLGKEVSPINLDISKYENNDDENKENIALEHDSDNDSFHENMNSESGDIAASKKDDFSVNIWRRASYSDSIDFNESHESHETLSSCRTVHNVDELLVGVLKDLTELLREGYDWEQCARWLRGVRERFPHAPDKACYWECRAALEEARGDVPASLQCWEQALANGTQRSIAEANLDQLLDKFMQLKISPGSGKHQPDPKLVDIKNVFKSTIIRFGVKQAKSSQSNEPVKFTVTPVRRSSRLSIYGCMPRNTPLRVCATLQEASKLGPIDFVPNKALNKTP